MWTQTEARQPQYSQTRVSQQQKLAATVALLKIRYGRVQ